MNRIILDSVSKSYNGTLVLLIDHFEIPLEGINAIVGWSGSGKTTLLNIISLMDYPDECYYSDPQKKPEIRVETEENNYKIQFQKKKPVITKNKNVIIKIAEFRREVFGFIFQDHLLHPNLTVDYNIKTPLLTNSKTLNKENIQKVTDKLGISKIIHQYPRQISGGEAQRAAILRGLLKNNPVIFGDEITNNLDYVKSNIVLKDIKTAVQSTDNNLSSFIWVSHDIHLIAKFADNIILIQDGHLTKHLNTFQDEPGNILKLLEQDDQKNNDELEAHAKKANVFSLLQSKKAKFIEKQKYFISYAYNDLFSGFLKPTMDLAVVYFSILLVLLFLLSILKISHGTNRFLVMKLSDPRINSLEITTSGQGEDMLTMDDYNEIKEKYKNIKYISPLYYSRISIRDLKTKHFKSAGNAISFRQNDPVLTEIIGKNSNAKFLDDPDHWKGLIIHASLAKRFGIEKNSKIEIKFNYFNTNENLFIDCLVVDTPLPFNKKMMIREEFYINSFKEKENEENPGIQYIVLYPETVNDTYAIKESLEKDKAYEIYEAFKLSGKLKIIDEMRKNMKVFIVLSFSAILILTILFIVLTVFRNLNKKQKEFGVFLAFGMPKKFFMIFYMYEVLLIWLFTTISAYYTFILLFETLIDSFLLKSNVTNIIGKFSVDRIITPEMLKLDTNYYIYIFGFELVLMLVLYLGTAAYFASKQPVQLIKS